MTKQGRRIAGILGDSFDNTDRFWRSCLEKKLTRWRANNPGHAEEIVLRCRSTFGLSSIHRLLHAKEQGLPQGQSQSHLYGVEASGITTDRFRFNA